MQDLAVWPAAASDEIAAYIDVLEKAIREIERKWGFLEEIKASSSNVKNGAGHGSWSGGGDENRIQ